MDLFARNRSKVKKKIVIDPPLSKTVSNNSTTPQSPRSPHHVHPNDEYFTSVRLTEGGSSSIRSSQSSSIPSTDSEYTNVDIMTDAEIEDSFERMLTRRGIHDSNARSKMSSFSMEKKRLMVSQDIQSESNLTSLPRRTDKKSDHFQSESKGPDYYVRKLSDMSKGVNTKIVSHLAVGLRTMPLSWVRQFIDMQGLQIITNLLKTLRKTKNM
ncbi:diaphanous GTPase-binding domain-containing protein [Cokeromyces recurvatus]|uniref:diaphanous GTPase-binding domain-containing protein n=1 Tax=Cokeromyces recurvatus TaxID=90255 RepID=UPI00222061CB|nr:diaphanous GTPase-binding domain-containing protein [Cokeromyces recurvatus]KAI7901517.1 diaphanous GTPase-binding domain-containing protein [Cokeromyces recurvatus]